MEIAHRLYETQLAELTTRCQKNEDLLDEIHTKNLYLEAYSRRENIKFTNIEESTEIGGRSGEDTEEVLRNFLKRDLGYRDARNVENSAITSHRKKQGWKSAPYSGPLP